MRLRAGILALQRTRQAHVYNKRELICCGPILNRAVIEIISVTSSADEHILAYPERQSDVIEHAAPNATPFRRACTNLSFGSILPVNSILNTTEEHGQGINDVA